MNILLSTLTQGFIFGIAALGIYITFRILDFPDLSVDGTFTSGASVCAISITNGIPPLLAILFSILVGGLIGTITGLLHVKFKITNIMAGIIVMIGLYSVNLRIMGKSNIHLFNVKHIFTDVDLKVKLMIVFAIAVTVKILWDLFFKTQIGFVLKALGDNPTFVTSLGLNTNKYKVLGLIIANGCVALSGGLYAQYQGFSDIGMGTGIIVSALAAIVIGEMLFKRINFLKVTTIVIAGSLIYRIILSISLRLGLKASDLKLVTAIIMILILSGLIEKITTTIIYKVRRS